ncbi:MAG: hypothetical protein KatS3mg110_0641 [Pirellulaceae bacterium]|nr:MAG: hypothetical protein KatS3mg110_0641 [Pirellulaceae bacterium]
MPLSPILPRFVVWPDGLAVRGIWLSFFFYTAFSIFAAMGTMRADENSAAPIEGDMAALDRFHAALSALPLQYPKGRIVVSGRKDRVRFQQLAVIWDGSLTYMEGLVMVDQPPQKRWEQVYIIQTPRETITYRPAHEYVERAYAQSRGWPRLTPQESWFGALAGGYGPWSEVLNPLRARQGKDPIRFHVRSSGEEIRVDLAWRDVRSTVRGSFALGGVVTSWQFGNPGDRLARRGEARWDTTPQGLPVLHSVKEWFGPDVVSAKEPTCWIEVHQWDLNYAVSEQQFRMEGLPLPKGTRIITVGSGPEEKISYWGGPPTLEDILKRRAEELRKRGFARENAP